MSLGRERQMRRRFRWDKQYLYWGITAFSVIACAILFYMALNYIDTLKNGISALIRILSPFIWGLVIVYLLHPLVRFLQRKVFGKLCLKLFRKKPAKGNSFARILSVIFAEIIMLALITGLFFLIIPQLYSSIETIVVNSPTYIDSLTTWATKMLTNYPEISDYVADLLGDVNTDIIAWLQTTILPKLGSFLSNVSTGVRYVVTGVYNLVIGIIVSIYLLSNFESFSASTKRMIYSVLSVDTARKFLNGLRFADRTFNGFLMGKLLDSAIIGLICYIVCILLNMPYALLVSVMVGVTNIIPFFGPLIGAIPSAIIILMVDPFKCLVFVIFVILLQQLDGNFIGPKILGSTVGISGFWVMFSIIFGAGLFGFWGMLLGVPVFVVIYTVINEGIERKLRRSDLPVDAESYANLDYIDPITLEPIQHETVNKENE